MNYLKYGWYYTNLQSRAPAWTGVNEFWQFGTTNKSVGLKLAPVNQEETQVADIVQLSNGNVFYHTVLITKITKEYGVRKLFVAAHDNAAFDKPLESYGAAYLRFARPFD